MSAQSRRSFLKSASIATVGVGALAAVPTAAQAATATPEAHPLDSGAAHAGSFTVWVKNADTGRIAVLVGESEVTYTDKKLAKRLARIAARANS